MMKTNNENKKTKRKFSLGIFVKVLVALVVLTAMLLSTVMGTVTAEFVKSLSKTLDFAATPSDPYQAYIIDGNNGGKARTVYYDNLKNIKQDLVFNSTKPSRSSVFEIKLPVTDPGLYNLDFTVRIVKSNGNLVYINNPQTNLVGCKVNTHRTGFSGNPTTLITDVATKRAYNTQRVYGPDPYGIHTNHGQSGNINYSVTGTGGTTQYCHDYQWKTLAPSFTENVSLAFYLKKDNVALWAWDFRGLDDGTYTITLDNISITKIDTPDNDEPYLDFPDTHYINNALFPTATTNSQGTGTAGTQLLNVQNNVGVVGHNTAGKTRTAVGRGTYLTEATYNSMTMQAESLVFGYHNGTLVNTTYAEKQGWANHESYSNLVVFGIPIKNVKTNKSYKVTFDVSFARQGYNSAGNYMQQDIDNLSQEQLATYAPFDNVLGTKETTGTLHFQSYLYNGMVKDQKNKSGQGTAAPWNDNGLGAVYNIPGVTDGYLGRGNFIDSSKMLYSDKGAAITRYDNIAYVNSGAGEGMDYSTVDSVNDLYHTKKTTVLGDPDILYNTLNAVRHTEYNGENAINWITFTNTTFSFNTKNYTDAELANLRWMWAIDAFVSKAWNRIKFDNVRIEEVESYGSNVENNSLTFNGVKADKVFKVNGNRVGFETYENLGLYRGANGTGQNFQARTDPDTTFSTALMNTFGPVYDASKLKVTADDGNQRIGLSGYAVCKGGIEKYVWSADGGETWYDMESQYLSDITSDTILNLAELHAENSIIGLTKRSTQQNFVDFTVGDGDGKNAQYSIVANLKGTPYENAFDLDIIFAAIPCSNANARLELMRVTHYNELTNYRTYTSEIESDIEVTTKGNLLNATYNMATLNSGNKPENTVGFSTFRGYNFAGGRTLTEGFSKRIDSFSSYKDIPPTFSNIPVKTTLKIRGWAMLEHMGATGHYWSVDYGKTWHKCEGNTGSAVYADIGDKATWEVWGQRNHRHLWYDGNANEAITPTFLENLWFNEKDQGITANLSDYVGQTVDVIFAGKSEDNNTYCPVARIDNVAVYGNPDLGNYGSGVRGAGPGPFFVHYDSKEWNEASVYYQEDDDVVKVIRNNAVVLRCKLDSAVKSNWKNTENNTQTLTSMEVYNVNIESMRVYNKTLLEVKQGDRITPHGWMVCRGGVDYYKYIFFDGTNWNESTAWKTVDATATLSGDAGGRKDIAVKADATFTANDTLGGGFREVMDPASGNCPIIVPNNVSGRCNLCVIAVSHKGYSYPVTSIALNVTS